MKLRIVTFGLILFSYTAFSQWTGTDPVIQSGAAKINKNLTIGNQLFGIAPVGVPSPIVLPERKLNIFRKHIGGLAYPLGAPLSSYTTGLKIVHNVTAFGPSPEQNYNWEIAASNRHLFFHYGNDNRTLLTMKSNGRIGVGVINPDATLQVKNNNGTGLDSHLEGFTLMDGNQASLLLGAETNAPYGEWGIEYNQGAQGLNFWKPAGASTGHGNYYMFIKNNGKVSIGLDPLEPSTYNGNYKLYVADGIMTERVKVALRDSSDWADYVFEENYDLKPLSYVKSFIEKNKHLPGVPSAEEVVEKGIDLGKMDALLLQKIEELTLYIIELESKIEKQNQAKNKKCSHE
ncbi:hypothetical protein [Tenacibaculum xiamenense]|uniref:hypothetical protein n=1 Tax=Tenacibaculum xiamenense TaxID=1261553 RepID=UPI00389533B5